MWNWFIADAANRKDRGITIAVMIAARIFPSAKNRIAITRSAPSMRLCSTVWIGSLRRGRSGREPRRYDDAIGQAWAHLFETGANALGDFAAVLALAA